MKLFREWLREKELKELNEAKETIISEDYILNAIKKFKLKKDNFIVWDRPSKGYKNFGIALDKHIYLYYIMGSKVKIEVPSETKIEGLEEFEKYNIAGDRKGFAFAKELKSKLISFFNELNEEIKTHWIDVDIKEKQPKYPDMKF